MAGCNEAQFYSLVWEEGPQWTLRIYGLSVSTLIELGILFPKVLERKEIVCLENLGSNLRLNRLKSSNVDPLVANLDFSTFTVGRL